MSRSPAQLMRCLLAAAVLMVGFAFSAAAKSYSSGGRSYSSHSSSSFSAHSGSSHSFSSSSHSYSSGSSHSSTHSSGSSSSGSSSHTYGSGSGSSSASSSGGSTSSRSSSSDSGQSYRSGTGKSYSSGSTWNDSGRHSYTSGKSYSSGFGRFLNSGADAGSTVTSRKSEPDASSGGMAFDTAAARARREQSSKEQFTQFKDAQLPSPKAVDLTPARTGPATVSTPSYRVQPPPVPSSSRSYRTVYIPDTQVIRTRPVRVYNVFNPYWSRPVVVYRDPYSSLFWWWLLDQSLDNRAWWAYHHRYDMDPLRYQALLDNDRQLEARVAELETQQAPRDPNYTPTGLDHDLMYSDQHVARVYSNRPTTLGVVAFWALGIPLALGFTGFFIWLIWFKRWQTAT